MCNKNCKNCDYPCINQGENLQPVTIDKLKSLGYILCDDYTEDYESCRKNDDFK